MAFLYPFVVFLQPGVLWPELIPYRPLLLVSLIFALLTLAQRGAAAQWVDRMRHPIFIWQCVFVLLQPISVYYGGGMEMIETLNFWLTYLAFVAVSLLLVRDDRTLNHYVAGVLVGSAVVIVYGLHAVYTHSPKLAGNRAGAYGMYENHNDYSFIILMSLPYAYMGLRLARRWFLRLGLMLFVVSCVVGILLSLSRGGILCLVLMLALLYWRSTSGAKRIAGLAGTEEPSGVTRIPKHPVVFQF